MDIYFTIRMRSAYTYVVTLYAQDRNSMHAMKSLYLIMTASCQHHVHHIKSMPTVHGKLAWLLSTWLHNCGWKKYLRKTMPILSKTTMLNISQAQTAVLKHYQIPASLHGSAAITLHSHSFASHSHCMQ